MAQPDRHMPFFRVLDAARQSGCLLCRLISTHTRRYIESVLYESVNDTDFSRLLARRAGVLSSMPRAEVGLTCPRFMYQSL